MLFATVNSLFNKSYADEHHYVVRDGNQTEYEFNANDILQWAAWAGNSTNWDDVAASEGDFPFKVVRTTEEQYNGKDGEYPECIELKQKAADHDNHIDSREASAVLRACTCQFDG